MEALGEDHPSSGIHTNRQLILGARHLRRVLAEWVTHFNGGRPHQGIEQRIPSQPLPPNLGDLSGRFVACPVLGGLHHDYRRAA